MDVDLVRVTTTDGVPLDGVLHAPETDSPNPVDVYLCLHGAGGNFYGSPPFAGLWKHLTRQGFAVLRANTRGHDIIGAGSAAARKRIGAAYEVVDECRQDVEAWFKFLAERGYTRLGLLGHSLGAIKAIYAAAHDLAMPPHHLVALSPPCLSYERFRRSSRADVFRSTLQRAETFLAEDEPWALLEVSFPLPMVISAASYVDKYGPQERYNILRYVDRLPCPALITYGELELAGNPAFSGLPEEIKGLTASERLETATIPGANHMYTGTLDALSQRLQAWWASL